jgi:hypothetical protein
MDESWSEWIWRAARIITFAVMAAVIFVSAMALWGRMASDLELAIAGLEVVGWEDADLAPMGAVVLSGDVDEKVQDYIPLLGFVWLSSLVPVGLGLFLAAGLAIVYYSRRPPVPGSYLTPRALAVGVAVALLGVAAWPVFSCAMYEWTHVGQPLQPFGEPPVASVGCYGLGDSLGPLFLGCLLLVLAALFPRSLWLGALGGGLVGVVVVLVLAPFVWGLGFWWLPLLLGAVGVAAGSWLASHHAGWSHVEGERLQEQRRPTTG